MPELHFKGKEYVYNHHLTVPYRPLVAHSDKSIGDASENLVIHGDNLHALKALLPRYAGKVDCIVIDPPYNTGNENWIYNDNVNSPIMKEWLDGSPVNKEDMLRHDKWCCMMYPRLKLLHELLSDTGSIWVTLDQNEIHRAKLIFDEIFGDENLVANISWLKVYSSRMDAQGFSQDVDQILVYAKDINNVEIGQLSFLQNQKQFTYIETGTNRKARLRSLRKEGKNSLRGDRPNMWYPIEAPDGSNIWPIKPNGTEGCWRWEEKAYLKEIKHKPSKILIEKNDKNEWEIWVKQYFEGGSVKPPSTYFSYLDYGHTHEALVEIKKIFGKNVFQTPKPIRLIQGIVRLATKDNSMVLDSFAGSATTAHAVLAQNAKDGGNRRFILVECEDYADTLTAERVRRVINGYEYQGTQREELLREKITWSNFSRNNAHKKLLDQVQSVEKLESGRFDRIKKSIKDGELIVAGEKNISEKMEGLGGGFTYYTLGDSLDLDKMLTGESLPDYASIGAWLFHTATGEPLDLKKIKEKQSYLGQSVAFHVWLIYKPALDFLKSSDAALTLTFAEKIAKKKNKRHLVFAPARVAPNKMLLPLGVEYAPLPFALYRFEKE